MTIGRITFKSVIIIFLFTFFACKEETNKSVHANTETLSANLFIDTAFNFKINKSSLELPKKLKENSGLIYYRDYLWTLEDAGSRPKIYALKTKSGKIKQSIELLNANNNDWEDMTQDEKFIYVGDFGNNNGDRSVFKIYKISKNGIPWKGNFDVEPEIIEYSYPDQHDLRSKFHKTNFDCEALISKGDSLFLFTKNWLDRKTNVYYIPNMKGAWLAKFCGSFNVRGLITGAAISPDEKTIVLCGNQEKLPFIWSFSDFIGNDFFSGNKIRLNLNSLFGVQIEGICFKDNDNLFLSNEKSAIPPSLFETSLNQINENLNTK